MSSSDSIVLTSEYIVLSSIGIHNDVSCIKRLLFFLALQAVDQFLRSGSRLTFWASMIFMSIQHVQSVSK